MTGFQIYKTTIFRITEAQFSTNKLIAPWHSYRVRDLMNNEGQFLTQNQLIYTFDIKCNLIEYHSIISMIKTVLRNRKYNINKTELYSIYPQLPKSISIFFKHKKGTKDMYNCLLNEKYVKPTGMLKWNNMFNLSEKQWHKIFFLPFMCTEDTKLRWFQSRINL